MKVDLNMIGSLQITVPAGCMNDCTFCVYRQHATRFASLWYDDREKWVQEVEKRLRYAAERVTAVMITSQGEPTVNIPYILDIMAVLNRTVPELAHVELQTSGVGLTEEKLELLYESGIRVISLSIPALDKDKIVEIMRVPETFYYDPLALADLIRAKGFILRLSIAMTTFFDDYTLEEIMDRLREWSPDQVTFRRIYGADHVASKMFDSFADEFKSNDMYRKLELLSLGVWKYDAEGIGVVWIGDCMVTETREKPRYLILQPDGRLYTRWDTRASVVF